MAAGKLPAGDRRASHVLRFRCTESFKTEFQSVAASVGVSDSEAMRAAILDWMEKHSKARRRKAG